MDFPTLWIHVFLHLSCVGFFDYRLLVRQSVSERSACLWSLKLNSKIFFQWRATRQAPIAQGLEDQGLLEIVQKCQLGMKCLEPISSIAGIAEHPVVLDPESTNNFTPLVCWQFFKIQESVVSWCQLCAAVLGNWRKQEGKHCTNISKLQIMGRDGTSVCYLDLPHCHHSALPSWQGIGRT